MKVLADENVPLAVIHALRASAHEVTAIREELAGAPDEAVIDRAARDGSLLLTLDKDFGDLVFRSGRRVPGGVVLLRITMGPPAQLAKKIVAIPESRSDWAGQFCVVGDDRVRMAAQP